MNFPRRGEKPEIRAQRADGLAAQEKFSRGTEISANSATFPAVTSGGLRFASGGLSSTVDFDGSPALPRSKSMISRYTGPWNIGSDPSVANGSSQSRRQEALRRSSDGNKQLVTVMVDLDQFVLLGQTVCKSFVEDNGVHIGKRHCKRFGPQWIIDE